MNKSRRQLQLLWAVLFLIAVYSAEALLLVKDADLLEASLQAGFVNSADAYISAHLLMYTLHILVPFLFAAAVFFIPESRWNRIFRGIFTLLLFGAALMRLSEGQTGSVFYYLSLAGYAALLFLLHRNHRPVSEANK